MSRNAPDARVTLGSRDLPLEGHSRDTSAPLAAQAPEPPQTLWPAWALDEPTGVISVTVCGRPHPADLTAPLSGTPQIGVRWKFR